MLELLAKPRKNIPPAEQEAMHHAEAAHSVSSLDRLAARLRKLAVAEPNG